MTHTFTDTSPIAVGQPTRRSDVNKVYDNTFYLREILEEGVVGGETIAVGEWCVMAAETSSGKTVGRWYKSNGTSPFLSYVPKRFGVCIAAMTAGGAGKVRTTGAYVTSGLTPGSLYYFSDTAGAIAATSGTNFQIAGVALSSTVLRILGEQAHDQHAVKIASASAPTGSGIFVLQTSPTLIAPNLGTPSAGVLTNCSGLVSALDSQNGDTGNVGTGVDNLKAYTIPAAHLAFDGYAVRITGWGTNANTADTKELILDVDGQTVTVSFDTGGAARTWEVDVILSRVSSTSLAYRIAGSLMNGTPRFVYVGVLTGLTLTNPLPVKFTGEGTTTNDIVQSGMIVESIKRG